MDRDQSRQMRHLPLMSRIQPIASSSCQLPSSMATLTAWWSMGCRSQRRHRTGHPWAPAPRDLCPLRPTQLPPGPEHWEHPGNLGHEAHGGPNDAEPEEGKHDG
jgi:hypothetical protein